MSTAVVVGSGPNGLAAAVTLAEAGMEVTVLEAADEIGGGTRTSEAIVPGLLHDHCSAIHPMAVGSPFLAGLGLDRYGLTWACRRSTASIRSTTAEPGCCTARSTATADGLGRRRLALAAAVRLDRPTVRRALPTTSWGRCCGYRGTR